ncbi:ribosome hibernation-promoting factor, HPF/YfiA family [Thermovibrio ammonificans]|jgi:putative sigma-54 modulation protein|uniref:Ribosome hibernation promoting factor n=1 Tax=Thermovibrio ammonificans (strain DSM 15698 / JCM 12110 / HB-1) TaxID=648996 RepID=E8T456_THEA1|nr:ribosome-associated translation inhibitor RaiA [Thermovibrio ammonificans]ADU97385.1 sigma 54 modulation protein/ribosomal protein S30EA [Thermovibrio ammonificans HB-1]
MAQLKLNLIGDGIDLTGAIKNTLEEKLSKLEKYLGDDERREVFADVIVRKEKYRSSVEVVIYNVFDHTLRIKKETDDLYTAVDYVVDAAEKQLRRLKDKVKSASKKEAQKHKKQITLVEEEVVEKPIEIIEVEPELYKPISVEDAVMKLLGSNREFVVFCNVETGNAAVVYKRKDGNIGLIQMPSCR